MLLGKVLKSNSHVDYLVQIFRPGEVTDPPRPEDYAFGKFVRITVDRSDQQLIGIIYDTVLMNPDYGALGPRLSSEPALGTFSPDFIHETSIIVGVAAIGWQHSDGSVLRYFQGVPPVACQVHSAVETLDLEEFKAFHHSDNGPRVAYLPRLAAMSNPAMPELLNGLLTKLMDAFHENAGTLAVLRSNLDWSSRLARK